MIRRSKGFGLVEIMVALVIGLVVSLGVVQVFTASRATYLSQDSSARMQEDARYVLSKMVQEIRMTGMYGCLSFNNYVPLLTAIALPTVLDTPILWDNTARTLRLVTADIGNTGASPTWTIITNCQNYSQIYAGAQTPGTGQTAFPLRQLTYTQTGSTLTVRLGTGLGQGAAQEVLQNVAAFNIDFGMAGSPMTYSSAITAGNAGNILSVRISLTLSDPNNRVRNQTYTAVAYLRNRF